MYQISRDIIHNKIVITLHQNMKSSDFYGVDEDLKRLIPTMQPRFSIINDISRYRGIDPFPEEIFHESVEFIKLYNVGKVIRVVGGSRNALYHFAKSSLKIENYDVIHVPTMFDAIQNLQIIGHF